MQKVAHHLQIQAHNPESSDRDAFARSAYNRYYYACFHLVRELLGKMERKWESANHSAFPEVLKGEVTKRLKRERNAARRRNDSQLVKLLDKALKSVQEMAKTYEEALAVRITADYETDVQVDFTSSDRFSLKEIDVTRAHSWYEIISTLGQTSQWGLAANL